MSVKVVSGTINGTGAALYVGLGFIPDKLRVWNLEASTPIEACWSRDMRTSEQIGGTVTSAAVARYTVGAGLGPYRGGDITAAANTAYVVPFSKAYPNLTNNLVDAGTLGKITTWTLGNSGNKTGNFNFGVNTSYVGEGSRVAVRVPGVGAGSGIDYDVFITALTNDGDAANEVTLSEAVPTGSVMSIGPMYDYIAAPAGMVMPKGFIIYSTALSVSGEMIAFEAETWTM